jgi:deazaflavin-dependent oxidoreductase (nitroreductase family)
MLSGMGGMPVMEVVTTGAKSGKTRAVMLTSPLKLDGQPVIVASKGGDPKSPGWYHNMVAHPEVEVTIKGKTSKMRARVLTPAERAETWPKVEKAYKGYAGYQQKTSREIPLVVLEAA